MAVNSSLTYKVLIDTTSARAQATALRTMLEREMKMIKTSDIKLIDPAALNAAKSAIQQQSAAMKQAGAVQLQQERQMTSAARASAQERISLAKSEGAARTAAAQAASVAQIEAERRLTAQVKAEMAARAKESGGGATGGGGAAGGLAGAVLGGFTATAAIAGLKALAGELDEVARRGAVFTQLKDVLGSYASAVGTTSEAMISAAKKASMGTIAEFELILNANRALQFEVAKTPEQFAKLIELSTALGRAQGISDTQALEYLTTGLARESRLILDNLGLIINLKDATDAYAESIGKTASQLTTAERKAALLEEAFRQGAVAIEANRNASDSAATQYERFDANIQNLKDSFGELAAKMLALPVGEAARALRDIRENLFEGGNKKSSLQERAAALYAEIEKIESADSWTMGPIDTGPWKESIGILPNLRDELRAVNEELMRMSTIDPTPITGLAAEDFQPNRTAADAPKLALSQWERAATEAIGDIGEQMESALLNRAKAAIPTAGIENVTAQMALVRDQLNTALNDMEARGLTDTEQIGFEAAALLQPLLDSFDLLEERAEAASSALSFEQMTENLIGISEAINNLSVEEVDFLPGMEAAREELIALSEEIAYTGSMTEEQAERFRYLSEAGFAMADSTGLLGELTAELGSEFLASNEYAAALVSEMYNADAAFRSGLISSDVYAGIMAALSGRLLTVAQAAGVATGAITRLNAAQGGRTSAAGNAAGSAVANRVQSQQATRERESNRREQERYNAEVIRQQERMEADKQRNAERLADAQERQAKQQEKAATTAAKTAEKAAVKAGKELEKGAKKAAQALTASLEGVDGLFSTSKVTDEDKKMSELGIYGDKADEYMRRLRDEVENGVDWADVSIEDAKAGLERVGIKAGESAEAILAQFEAAWNNQSLWADVANIEAFVNAEAVQQSLDLQEKSKIGRENILKFFGVVIEDAVDEIEAGLSGGGGGGVSAAAIEPIDLSEYEIDPADYYVEPPDLENTAMTIAKTIADGTDDLTKRTKESVTAAFEKTKSEFQVGVDSWLNQRSAIVGDLTPGKASGQSTITVDASPELKAILPALSARAAAPVVDVVAPAGMLLAPTLDAEKLQVLIDEITALAPSITAKIILDRENIATLKKELGELAPEIKLMPAADVGAVLVNAVGEQITAVADVFESHGTRAASYMKKGITTAMSVDDKDNVAIDFAGFLGGNLSAQAETLRKQGEGIAQMFSEGITTGSAVTLSPDGTALTPMISGLIQGLNVQIRTKRTDIMREGEGIAQAIQAGAANYFTGAGSSASAGGEEASPTSGISGAFMQALSTDFDATANMFYAVGYIPASNMQSGFKEYEYTGLAASFMDALTNSIRENTEALAQRGGTMASYVQSGFVSSFGTETFKAQLMAIGELMYSYIEMGLLNSIQGGKLTDAIATKVVADLATETEQQP